MRQLIWEMYDFVFQKAIRKEKDCESFQQFLKAQILQFPIQRVLMNQQKNTFLVKKIVGNFSLMWSVLFQKQTATFNVAIALLLKEKNIEGASVEPKFLACLQKIFRGVFLKCFHLYFLWYFQTAAEINHDKRFVDAEMER